MKVLAKYIISLVNLYGMVSPEMVRDIYNQQNQTQVSLEEVEAYLENPPKELQDNLVFPNRGQFVQEILLDEKEFAYLMEAQQGKDYYVPAKEELFQYVDEFYFEQNKQYQKLRKYLLKQVFPSNEKKTDEFCKSLFLECQYGFDTDNVAILLGEHEVPLDESTMEGLLPLIMNFANHSRRWEHKGHTPDELSK